MSFVGEIKRRKVFQVAAVYAVVAWLLVQIVATVEVPLNLPDWFDTVAIVLLAIGFPIAVILAWAFDLTPQGIRSESDAHVQKRLVPVHAGGQWLNYALQGLVLLAVGFLVIDQYVLDPGGGMSVVSSPASPSPASSTYVTRTNIDLGETELVGNTGLSAHLAFSPDGRRLAYAAQVDGTSQLYLRDLDQLDARLIANTEGAFYPFFSPDGEWIGFYDDSEGVLKKVSVRGGQPQTLADAVFTGGGSWTSDDTIVFASGNNSAGRFLFRIPATGGTPEVLFPPDPETGHTNPEVLPGGDAVLLVVRQGALGLGSARDASIAVLSLKTNELRGLIERGHTPRYSPTGHIVFVRDGDLWAVPFDPSRLDTTGPEVLVVDGVQQDGRLGGAAYTISNDGMLMYAPGGDTGAGQNLGNLAWVNRDGRKELLTTEPEIFFLPKISPDEEDLLVSIRSESDLGDIWIMDLVGGGPRQRLTIGQGPHYYAHWTPDGQHLIYWWDPPDEEAGLFRQAADGTGEAERLTASGSELQAIEALTPDGTQLIFRQATPSDDLYLFSLSQDSDPQPLLAGAYDERDAEISPDGQWIAYSADQTGQLEIYVRPFPNVGDGRWQISDGGGTEPAWGPDGSELYFRNGLGFFAVEIRSEGSSLSKGTPEEMFAGLYRNDLGSTPNYDVSRDGQRFVIIDESEQRSRRSVLVVVENWFEELERLAPTE
jgi:serine/threonine-protein kinase